ncbi:FIVAR domain-containing protein [Staphylococcus aureus]|nr:FIVAR domain-containing protein [Staphylococcus aureus]
MTNLNNALQDKTQTLNSINFTDADQAKKDAYTNAVSHAEGILLKQMAAMQVKLKWNKRCNV